MASVPGVQAATSVGPVSTVAQRVVTKLASVPAKQVPAGTNVGPVVTTSQLVLAYPFAEVGVTGVQALDATPVDDADRLQTVRVHWLPELAAASVQDPGITA